MSVVSVVIPTYNAAGFLANTLRTVAAQTRLPGEVVVVDDCSRDDTKGVVTEWSRTTTIPVRFIRLPRNTGGPATPLNVGIEAATGELIAPLDHDDILYPRKLELQTALFAARPELGLVMGRVDKLVDGKVDPSGQRYSDALAALVTDRSTQVAEKFFVVDPQRAFDLLISHTCYAMTCSNLLFPKRAWAECGGFDTRYRSICDYQFLLAMCRHHPIGFVNEYLVGWRTSADSLSRSALRQGVTIVELYRLLRDIDTRRLSPAARVELRKWLCEYGRGSAYWNRENGRYRQALLSYVDSMTRGHVTREATAGIVKLLPHAVRTALGRLSESSKGRSQSLDRRRRLP